MKTTPTHENWNFWYNQIYGYFYRRIDAKSQVEDLTAETLEIFFLTETEIQNPRAFIFKIATNKLKEYIRNKQKNTLEIDTKEGEFQYSDNYLYKNESLIECAKNQLAKELWELVELCVICDFNSQTVAQKIGLKPDNVRQKLKRALAKLREKCKEIWLKAYPN